MHLVSSPLPFLVCERLDKMTSSETNNTSNENSATTTTTTSSSSSSSSSLLSTTNMTLNSTTPATSTASSGNGIVGGPSETGKTGANGTTGTSSNVETEYREINSKNAWPILYQYIRSECNNYKYTCDESKKPENKNLNRYRDVSPYDHSRIILKKSPCNYINANILRMERANRQYILTQGPLPSTAGHFWLMVWEQNSKSIIMLNKVIEKNQVKCHQYWPLANSTEPTMTFSDVELKVEFVSKTKATDYTTSTLRLTNLGTNESREILHFHYTTWPDFGVPQSPMAFLRFLADVRQSGALDQHVGPPVVHCSAGIGRSGTFCLVDTCLVLIEKNGLNSVNVREVLLEMRRSRMGLIQTPDQLWFSYAAIIEGSKHLPLTNTIGSDETLTNHYDVVNNSSLEDDDEPPPLPPPRGESLTRSMKSDQTPSPNNENENPVSNPPNKPLPCEPPRGISNSNSMANHTNNNDDDASSADPSTSVTDETIGSPSSPESNELRRRRMEKNERLETQLREIKRKQHESEEWQKFKRSKVDSSEKSTQEETETSS
ncbi:tyrosine-protein phosphatase non-receptor type 1 isoform X2 [Copidosoma floridanum]|uniref:tyrosine-protein phosphatase non-receptor type 1 isoform X2 n=1 Tax=Copidosoma floridanum TaxID=29053 RepID=UPI0006C98937|nr:tyrosine-protein phosphatase non-receptor type 1 isoform X2 [Copidosoma floridanum]